jgi:hypothetical protein
MNTTQKYLTTNFTFQNTVSSKKEKAHGSHISEQKGVGQIKDIDFIVY